jgi:putative flippase GtrA
MNSNKFNNFVLYVLRVLFFTILVVSSVELAMYMTKDMFLFTIIAIFLVIGIGITLYYMIKKQCSSKNILLFLLTVGFLLRLVWVLSIDNKPISDFNRAYIVAGDFLNGDLSGFRGTSYIARFPHLTGLVLYFAFIRRFFSYPLIVLKIINVILSSSNILIVYGICRKIFKNNVKKAYYGAFITALYPPLLIYTGVYCTENMAIPFYLLSVYLFISGLSKSKKYMVAAGFVLVMGHLFRAVGQVMLIAYLMTLFIYTKDSLVIKVKKSICILLAFIIPFVGINSTLKAVGITQFDLWKGSESAWTSVLKGTNQDSWGRWNHEDAVMFDKYENDNEALARACKEEIKKRLTNTPVSRLVVFYLRKFSFQWREGDFSASYWAVRGTEPDKMVVNVEDRGALSFQLFYVILLILSYLSLYNKKGVLKNPLVMMFYIIFCGYSMLYLITESQDRYSFIACWLMIFMALNNSEETINIKDKREDISVGVANVIVPTICYYSLTAFKVNYVISIFIGYIIAAIITFILYRKDIFKSKVNFGVLIKLSISSIFSIVAGILVVYVVVYNGIASKKAAPIPIIILAALINYLVQQFWMKRREEKHEKQVDKPKELV